jgi:glycosyltransferase 2 family protein
MLGILLLWLITRGQDLELIVSELRQANYWWIILVMLISLVSHVVRATRWNILIASMGFRTNTRQTFLAVMTGYLSNLALPRLGEVTKCAVLSKTTKVPFNALIGTVVSERVVDFFTLVFIAFLTLTLQFHFIIGFLQEFFFGPVLALGSRNFLLLAIVALGLLAMGVYTIFFLHRKFKEAATDTFYYKLRRQWIGFGHGVKTLWRMERKGAFLFQTFLIWGMYFLTVYLCFFALGATSHLSPMAGLTLLAVGSLGILAPVPGGIGTYHFITIITLTELYGIITEQATSYAYIAHAAQMLIVLLAGGAAWLALSLQQNKTQPSGILNPEVMPGPDDQK